MIEGFASGSKTPYSVGRRKRKSPYGVFIYKEILKKIIIKHLPLCSRK